MGRALGISCACGRQVETYLGRGFVGLLWEDDDTGILARLGMTPISEAAESRRVEADEFTLSPGVVTRWIGRLRRACLRAGSDLPPFYRIWQRTEDDRQGSAAPVFRLGDQLFFVEAHDTLIGVRAVDEPGPDPVVETSFVPSEKTLARWLSAEAMSAEDFDQVFAGTAYQLERGTVVEAFATELSEIEQLAEHASAEGHGLTCFHY